MNTKTVGVFQPDFINTSLKENYGIVSNGRKIMTIAQDGPVKRI